MRRKLTESNIKTAKKSSTTDQKSSLDHDGTDSLDSGTSFSISQADEIRLQMIKASSKKLVTRHMELLKH
jgi:hypothetical protein